MSKKKTEDKIKRAAKLKGIRIQGRCFTKPTDLVFFPDEKCRIAIVYGSNGSGKSTIAEAFRCLYDQSELKSELFDQDNKHAFPPPGERLLVYDETFVDENLKPHYDETGAIISFGFQKRLQEIMKELNRAKEEVENARPLCTTMANKVAAAEEALMAAAKKVVLKDGSVNDTNIPLELWTEYFVSDKSKLEADNDLAVKHKAVACAKLEIQKLEFERTMYLNAIDNINAALARIFLSKHRLSLKLKKDNYYVYSNGRPIKKRNASTGECNVIALSYFFAMLLSARTEQERYQEKTLVVIDDPISSVDFDVRIGILSYLRSEIYNIISGDDKSHVVLMTHDLMAFYELQKLGTDIVSEYKNKYPGKGLSVSQYFLENHALRERKTEVENEYSKLIDKVYRFALANKTEKTKQEELTIGNVMRRVVEAFSTFIYCAGPDDLVRILKERKELRSYYKHFRNLMNRLVLNGESHYQVNVCTMKNSLCFLKFTTYKQKQKTCKDILMLLYLIFPEHVLSHLVNCMNYDKGKPSDEMKMKAKEGFKNTLENWKSKIPV